MCTDADNLIRRDETRQANTMSDARHNYEVLLAFGTQFCCTGKIQFKLVDFYALRYAWVAR